jgi:hypothetical protein
MTQRLTQDQLRARVLKGEVMVPVGCIYQHLASGREYIIERVSLQERDLALLVTYVPVDARDIPFTRQLGEFLEKFTFTGTVSDLHVQGHSRDAQP